MSKQRQQLGRLGERFARHALEARGYVVVGENVRTPFGELDLVVRDGRALVFVEVKTRRTQSFGRPEDALTKQKREHLRRAIAAYLDRHPWAGSVRLDVVGITVGVDGPRIRYLRNALSGMDA